MELTKAIKLKDGIREMTFNEVYKQFENFIHKKSNEFLRNFNNDYDESFQTGLIGLMKAYNTYRKLDILFFTYTSTVVTNEYLMAIRKCKKRNKDISINEVIHISGEGNKLTIEDTLTDNFNLEESMVNKETLEILKTILNQYEGRERYIAYNAIYHEVPQIEIANRFNISQSYVSRLEKRIFKEIKRKLLKGEVNMNEIREENKKIFNKAMEMLEKGKVLVDIRNSLKEEYKNINATRIDNILAKASREYKERKESIAKCELVENIKVETVAANKEGISKTKGVKEVKKLEEFIPQLKVAEKQLKINGIYGAYVVNNGIVTRDTEIFEDVKQVEEYGQRKIKEINNMILELKEVFKLAEIS